ncbi:MAG: response regulator [Acidobacteriota bacterium]|nr:response regulator [Acidobacteriota bacterium]
MTTVLLVDDDPMQAIVRKAALERRFKHVVRASDAAEALGLMEKPQFADSVDLVITDLNLPGLSGPAFAKELHARVPSMPILVLNTTGESHAADAGESIRFLDRPFRAEDILIAATQMISHTSP